MAVEQSVVRQEPGAQHWSLLCGRPGCDRIARHILEFDWLERHWHGVLGACDEHREDIATIVLEQRRNPLSRGAASAGPACSTQAAGSRSFERDVWASHRQAGSASADPAGQRVMRIFGVDLAALVGMAMGRRLRRAQAVKATHFDVYEWGNEFLDAMDAHFIGQASKLRKRRYNEPYLDFLYRTEGPATEENP